MTLPIFLYGSDILRERATEADLSDPAVREELTKLINDMKETMEKADGVGLAAPQVGKLYRLLVANGSPIEDVYPELAGFKRVVINPVIKDESERQAEYNEGCLSIPDVHADIKRPAAMTVTYFNENFEPVEERLEGFACRIIQHEMDHLDGVLFVDRAAPIRKKMISSRLGSIKSGKIKTHYRTTL
jgi:peptide deformylase